MKYYTRRKQWFEREVNFLRKNPLNCLGKAEREELVKIVKKLELMSIMNMEIINMYEEILSTSNQDCKSAKLKALSFMENT